MSDYIILIDEFGKWPVPSKEELEYEDFVDSVFSKHTTGTIHDQNQRDHAGRQSVQEDDLRSGLSGFSSEVIEKIDNTREILNNTPSTASIYKRNGRYTPEREKLHRRIIENLISGVKPEREKRFIITGGLPGSGKSTIVKREGVDNVVQLDADSIKQMLPEYDGWNAPTLHEESDDILMDALGLAYTRQLSILYDTTFRSEKWGREIVGALKDGGYKTQMLFAKVSNSESIKRAVNRFLTEGRFVDPIFISSLDDESFKNFERFKGLFDSYKMYDERGSEMTKKSLVNTKVVHNEDTDDSNVKRILEKIKGNSMKDSVLEKRLQKTTKSKNSKPQDPNAENVDLSYGVKVAVKDTDNHGLHLQAHRNVLGVLLNKSLRQVYGADKALKAMESHIREHENLYRERGGNLRRFGNDAPKRQKTTLDEWIKGR